MDTQRCKVWSKKHGHDTYDSDDSDLDEDEIRPKGLKKRTTGGKCKCGSTTHQRTTHSECCLNQKAAFQIRKNGNVVILSMTEHLKMMMSFVTVSGKVRNL